MNDEFDYIDDILDAVTQDKDEDKKPLYDGCTVTLGAFMLLLAIFCTKHNLIGEAVQQLLNIIALVLPQGHRLCTSLHAYKMFFKNLRNPLVHHYYCRHCLGYIDDKTVTFCPYQHCGKPFHVKDKTYFLEVPVLNQIKNLIAQDGFFTSLQHRFTRNVPEGTYEDIYDGQLYKSYFKNNGVLSNSENISFTFNTDGAPVFKSSNVSIWPIYLVVNELPYKLRMKKENMILAALWFGNKKPSMGTFLKPFLSSMMDMSEGIECFSPEKNTFTCKGYLLCGTADLPARCLLCNNVQFNGAFSCWKCKQKGESAKVGKGHTMVFPYNLQSPKGPERTLLSALEDAKTSVQRKMAGDKNSTIDGIKGPSWLMLIPKFHIIHGIAIDYMHGVLLGVQKLLLRLWFAKEFSTKHFSFHQSVNKVDNRLSQIRPTLDISRLPKSIQNDLKYWKASEYRSFLLFYGAAVLPGILDNERFSHFILLVNAMHILLKCGSTDAEVDLAEKMLTTFCQHFSKLYDKCYMTLNLHQLVHLADSVRYLGPLYTHSCFSFEDKNGAIMKMIKGTQCIDSQITTGIAFVQKLPELKQKCIVKGSKEEKIYNGIECPHLLKRGRKIAEGVFVLGGIKKRKLNQQEFHTLIDFLGEIPTTDTFPSFNRLEIKDMLVYGNCYKRMLKRDNSCICYTGRDGIQYGCVSSFLFLNEDEHVQSDCCAIISLLQCVNYNTESNILAVQITRDLDIVPVNKIKCSCMFIHIDENDATGHICLFPNRLELD